MSQSITRHAHVIRRYPPQSEPPRPPTARGTRNVVVHQEMGTDWFYSLSMELLGRNLATAGGLEAMYRLGLSHDAFRRAGRR